MHHIAPIEHQPSGSKRKPALKPRISKRMRQAIEMLITGEAQYQKDAALKVGLSPEHLSRELAKPHVRAFQAQRCVEMFAGLLPKAIRTVDKTMDGNNAQAALNAAITVLRQQGLVTTDGPSVAVTVNAPGYVIDLSGGRQIDHQASIEANALNNKASVPGDDWGTPLIAAPSDDGTGGQGGDADG